MSQAPLVSVVIPCFNSAWCVSDAISSALLQTYATVEVIVVDDGSTDSSQTVIRSFGASIRSAATTRRGAAAARNLGLAMARGGLIQFLDADDVLHPDKLAQQVSELLRSGADLVFCDAEVRSGGVLVDCYAREYSGEDPVVFMLRGGLSTPQPLHYRRNLTAVGGFREDLPCAQERDLHLRLACHGLSFRRLPRVLATIRRHEAGVSADSVRVLDQHAGILWPPYESLRQSGRLSNARARAFAGLLARDARAYLRHGCPVKAAEYFQAARRMHTSGGLSTAYRRPTRVLRSLIGPAATERLVQWKRTRV